MEKLTDKEVKLVLKYLMAIRILFVIARKDYKELNDIIKKMRG